MGEEVCFLQTEVERGLEFLLTQQEVKVCGNANLPFREKGRGREGGRGEKKK